MGDGRGGGRGSYVQGELGGIINSLTVAVTYFIGKGSVKGVHGGEGEGGGGSKQQSKGQKFINADLDDYFGLLSLL